MSPESKTMQLSGFTQASAVSLDRHVSVAPMMDWIDDVRLTFGTMCL